MYSKFAVALLASLVAARGDDNGVGRENAVSHSMSIGNDTVYVHLYNARVSNGDGTYTYEFHGDFGIDAASISRRFMYGFCIRPNIPPSDGSGVIETEWDCMTVKVDLSEGANITTRYVQDAWAPGDGTGYNLNSDFLAAWLTETADWTELAAKSSLCTEDNSTVTAGDPIPCTGFNTHFKRDFTTGEADKDYQLTTDMAGDEFQLSVFVQEYDSSQLWDDANIVQGTARNDQSTPSIATPVMQAFIDLAEDADDALTAIQDALRDAEDASDAIDALDARIDDGIPNFNSAVAASEAATTQADAQAALSQLTSFQADVASIKADLETELARITAAQAVADDAELEADADFEVPIRNEFGQKKSDTTAISADHTDDMAEIDTIVSDVAAAVTAAEAKVASLTPAPESDDDDDDDDDNTPDGDGDADPDGDGDDGEDGATSLTTFATVVVASVYALAF